MFRLFHGRDFYYYYYYYCRTSSVERVAITHAAQPRPPHTTLAHVIIIIMKIYLERNAYSHPMINLRVIKFKFKSICQTFYTLINSIVVIKIYFAIHYLKFIPPYSLIRLRVLLFRKNRFISFIVCAKIVFDDINYCPIS